MIAKPISIKDAERKFGGCVQKAVEPTPGDLRPVSLPFTVANPSSVPFFVTKSDERLVP